MRNLIDILAAHRHGKRFRAEPSAFTVRTGDGIDIRFELSLGPLALRFLIAALEVVDNPFEIGIIGAPAVFARTLHLDLFAPGSIKQGLLRLLRKAAEGGIE